MKEVVGQASTDMNLSEALDDFANLSEQEVRDYLVSHPEFFSHHPDLLTRLSIPHNQKGSVSLVELQGEQMRKKVRQLTHKLSQLIQIAKQNEQIYRVYADLNMRLLSCKSLVDAQLVLDEVMQEKLRLASVTLKPFTGPHALPEIQQKLFLEKRFRYSQFFFGRISDHERQLLFADKPAESVALMLLGQDGDAGMLAVGSKDSSHFNPDMDTLLIKQLQHFLSVLLPTLSGV